MQMNSDREQFFVRAALPHRSLVSALRDAQRIQQKGGACDVVNREGATVLSGAELRRVSVLSETDL
jgi:hypothetical protein